MMMIRGLFETHIRVSSLNRSMEFYQDVLGLKPGIVDVGRSVAFYWIGERGEAMLGLWESEEKISPSHFAFRCDLEDVRINAISFLKERNLEPYNFLMNGIDAPLVFAWMPALAIYFRDPDNHELEFIAMLEGEPNPELGIVTYEEWLEVQKKIKPAKSNFVL